MHALLLIDIQNDFLPGGALAVPDGDRVIAVANGFDLEDVAAAPVPKRDAEAFVIAHVGTLTASQHAPGLAEALVRLARDPDFARRLRVRFVGSVDAAIVAAFAAVGLGEVVEEVPYVPHAEAIGEMERADLLVAAVQDVEKNAGVIPAKVFEHLALGRPVLGLAPPAGDLAEILRQTGGGATFDHHDADGIAAFIHALATGPAPTPDPAALAAFDRRALAARLAEVFEEVSASPPSFRHVRP